MEDYTPNSNKYKREQEAISNKKIEKVVTGVVKTKKKSELRKFADVFISEDISNVKSYIFSDVLVPTIKKALYDMITNGFDMLLFGGTGRSKKSSLPGSKVSYRQYYDSPSVSSRSVAPLRNNYSYDDIILESRVEAEKVILQMEEIIDQYKIVRVADLYDLVGVSGNYTDNSYGWSDIRTARIERVRDGYILKMPKPMPID